MTLDVLLSAMHLEDYHYIDSLNITGNCIVINQCDKENRMTVTDAGRHITYIETTERGLSRSRNSAIDHSQADVCIFCDNDVEYLPGYEQMILEEYEKHPEYDIIIFHVESEINPIPCYPSPRKISYLTSGKAISYEISFKRTSINQIRLNERIGAGTKYRMGEENAFLYECLRKGLKIYYVPKKIAKLRYEASTWYTGFNKDFFIARGASFYAMTSRYSLVLIAQYAVRKYKLYRGELSFFNAVSYMLEGRKSYQQEVSHENIYSG